MRGRKPIPTALKILRGNPGRRPLNAQEPQIDEPLRCPSVLDALAKKEWRRMEKIFHPSGLLKSSDRAALSMYCQAWSRWILAEEELKKSGLIVKSPSGLPMNNPWLTISNKAMEQMKGIMTEFGLTPSSRSRIKTDNPTVKTGLEEFLGSGT